jgi:hypothetical protein
MSEILRGYLNIEFMISEKKRRARQALLVKKIPYYA